MEPGNLALFLMLALLSEIIGTIGGFGSSVFFVPVAGFFFDFHSVLGITALFHLSSNISKIALFRKGVDKRLLFMLGIPAVIFVSVGAWLSKYFDSGVLQLCLSVFLILLSLGLLLFRKTAIRATAANTFGGGALSGLTAGLLGTGGAIRGLTMAAFDLPKEIFIATSAMIDLAIDLSRSVVYLSNGYIHGHDLYVVGMLFGVGLIGTYAGKKILNHVTQQQFRSLALGLVLVTGLITLIGLLN